MDPTLPAVLDIAPVMVPVTAAWVFLMVGAMFTYGRLGQWQFQESSASDVYALAATGHARVSAFRDAADVALGGRWLHPRNVVAAAFWKTEGATLMISEQIAIQDPIRPAERTWRQAAASLPKVAILTFTSRVTRAIYGFVKAPMLPYAALFEAEMLLGMRRKREYFEPDPFATEAPFLDDSWPRV
jgi:hypothetical protein